MPEVLIRWDIDASSFPEASTDKKTALFVLQRMLPEYVWDIVHLEGNPYSFVEVQTLLQGTTVAGYSLFEQMQILNQEKSINELKVVVRDDDSTVNKNLLLRYHQYIVKEEVLKWGMFRDGQVSISGTDYMPPVAGELDALFVKGMEAILAISHPFERALAYFFFGALNQFFYDGNKRTSRLIMNTILMQYGYCYLSIPGDRKSKFDETMVNFYNTKDASQGFQFLIDCYQQHD